MSNKTERWFTLAEGIFEYENRHLDEVLDKVEFLDDNYEIKCLEKDALDFSYRHSIFMSKIYYWTHRNKKVYKQTRNAEK